MNLGFSIFFIAVGAILVWAVEDTVQNVDLAAVGVILMLVGGAGLLLSLAFWSSFSPFPQDPPWAARTTRRVTRPNTIVVDEPQQQPTVVVREQPEPPRRTVVVRQGPDHTDEV